MSFYTSHIFHLSGFEGPIYEVYCGEISSRIEESHK